MSVKDKLLRATARVDIWLKKVIGAENEILLHFARLLLAAVILSLLVGVAVWIIAAVFHAVSIVFWAFVAAAPYLLAIALLAGGVALAVRAYRRKSQVHPQPDAQGAMPGRSAPSNGSEAQQEVDGDAIRQALLTANQPTRSALEHVLAALQRFDHRLQLVISPAHYLDLFGDNWAAVRQFVESVHGRSVPEASAKLVEIIVLYKRAQDARWVPINHERIHAWWGEAARRRKWLSGALEAAAKSAAVEKRANDEFRTARPEPRTGDPPKFNAPPTLDDLLRYYEWIKPV
jgi:hypothetical protein